MSSSPLKKRDGPREEVPSILEKSHLHIIKPDAQGKSIDLAALEVETVPDYYHSPSEKFLVKNQAGRWLPHSAGSFKRILTSRGIKTKAGQSEAMAEADHHILDTLNSYDVSGYGPLCGRNAGFIEEGGTRFLVTENMNLIAPEKGTCPTIHAVLKGLFVASESEEIGNAQMHIFMGWLKSSVESLRAGRRQQQQALAICGEADCGKSLAQHLIVTPCLAGREADAYRAFLRGNDFNSNLFKAEHLFLDDCQCSTSIKDRLAFGTILKTHTVGASVKGLHAKGRDEINISPWWRITITLNDSPEAMMILPPLNEDIADKIILLRASRFDFPEPIQTSDEKERFAAKIRSEIPAFIYWLLNAYQIPEEHADPRRYNIATFHHPELKESLESLSPESELLELIDLALADDLQHGPVWITAEKLEERIRGYHARRADQIFTYRQSCGKYLHRLSVKHPKRVTKARTGQGNGWNIHPKIYDRGGCGGCGG